MRIPEYSEEWPESYKISHYYDQMEVSGKVPAGRKGYYYQYQNRKESVIQAVKKHLPDGGRILDVAAAQGNFTLTLAELGYEVTWNDLREELAGYVQQKYEKGKVSYAPGNVFDLEGPAHYDLVLITEVIEHVAHPDWFMQKMAALVRPGGYIVMSTPNGAYFLNKLPKFTSHDDPAVFESVQFKPDADGHIFLIHPEELSWFCDRAAVELCMVELYSNFLTNGHLKTELFLRGLPGNVVRWIERTTRKLPHSAVRKIHTGMTVVFRKKD